MRNFEAGAYLLAVLLIVVLIGGVLSVEVIGTGMAGVVYNRSGGIEDEVLGQGWHLVSPMKKVTEYPISTETVYLSQDEREGSKEDESFNINSKDGKMVNVDAEFSYRMDGDMLPHVFNKFRGRDSEFIANTFLRARLKEVANEVSTQFEVLDIYGEQRSNINRKTFEAFKAKVAEHGIIIENFAFTRIQPDADTLKAIQRVVDQRQALEEEKIRNEKAKLKQETIATENENKRLEAQGDAEAIKIRAQAEADANKIVKQSLSPELIEYKKWGEVWDGTLPSVLGGSDMTIMTDVRGAE